MHLVSTRMPRKGVTSCECGECIILRMKRRAATGVRHRDSFRIPLRHRILLCAFTWICHFRYSCLVCPSPYFHPSILLQAPVRCRGKHWGSFSHSRLNIWLERRILAVEDKWCTYIWAAINLRIRIHRHPSFRFHVPSPPHLEDCFLLCLLPFPPSSSVNPLVVEKGREFPLLRIRSYHPRISSEFLLLLVLILVQQMLMLCFWTTIPSHPLKFHYHFNHQKHHEMAEFPPRFDVLSACLPLYLYIPLLK